MRTTPRPIAITVALLDVITDLACGGSPCGATISDIVLTGAPSAITVGAPGPVMGATPPTSVPAPPNFAIIDIILFMLYRLKESSPKLAGPSGVGSALVSMRKPLAASVMLCTILRTCLVGNPIMSS